MPDYGHDLEFGYFLVPDADDHEVVLETARLADGLGYDLLAIQDHPYQPAHLDALVLAGVILAQTERIRVFHDVANLPLRPPAVFAKAAATLDVLSGGRFEAGLGGGGFLDAARAMGAPARTPGESLEALEEAVEILRASWSDERAVDFDGRHYRLERARVGPKPAHEIGIWLGAAKPRALALTGRVADGWAAPLMNYMPPAATLEAQALIDRAAREAGRDPSEIRRIYNMSGAFTADPNSGQRHRPGDRRPARALDGGAHALRAGHGVRHVPPHRPTRSRHTADVHRRRRPSGARARGVCARRPQLVVSRVGPALRVGLAARIA